ncbi:MAG: ornithine carbamoyltransferase [Limnochordia bacterium]
MHGRDFISLHDFTPVEVADLLALAKLLKQSEPLPILRGKQLAMIFTKASTRTRVSFEAGVRQLGGDAIVLLSSDTHIGRGEPIKDTARVLSRFVDGIMIRTYDHQDVLDLATWASIPVINGLTDDLHPCQAMADLLTIQEHKGHLAGLKMTYIGDGNNMATSLMFAGAKTGMHVTICCPPEYEPSNAYLDQARADARDQCRIEVVHDPQTAAEEADVLYTDVWASMGQEAERESRAAAFAQYQINDSLLRAAAEDCIIMHCLPAHRGEEITEEVIEGPHSVVFDQAENRLHAQKALMATLMGHPEDFV